MNINYMSQGTYVHGICCWFDFVDGQDIYINLWSEFRGLSRATLHPPLSSEVLILSSLELLLWLNHACELKRTVLVKK